MGLAGVGRWLDALLILTGFLNAISPRPPHRPNLQSAELEHYGQQAVGSIVLSRRPDSLDCGAPLGKGVNRNGGLQRWGKKTCGRVGFAT